MDQSAVIAWLESGAPWGVKPRRVETHAAIVFLVGERAYKLKKSVNLGYLDFSSLERRHRVLERELALNRRTAPDLYLRLVPVVKADGKLSLGGAGEALDYLLEMRRFPDGALLSEIADRGGLEVALVEKLAGRIAAFHASAEPIIGLDWPAAVKRIAGENAADLRALAPQLIEPSILERHLTTRDRLRAACAEALIRQAAAVRRCHGDLHLGNVFLDSGDPVLFDCIEFDDFYALIPPLYDIAFLLMDLHGRSLDPHANRALNAWIMAHPPAQWTELLRDLSALPLYLALRAEIRSKAEARSPSGHARARRYLDLAGTLMAAKPARLIAIGGLSGTGKSTLARSLAPAVGRAPGAIHLRTDEMRKRLAGVEYGARLPPSSYTARSSREVYGLMQRCAAAALSGGQAVVADAVFARPSEREAMERIAVEHAVPFVGLWLDAPVTVLESRLESRAADVSDADKDVLRRQLGYDTGMITWTRVDASRGAEAVLAAARARLLA
jgi:hypothetical protein